MVTMAMLRAGFLQAHRGGIHGIEEVLPYRRPDDAGAPQAGRIAAWLPAMLPVWATAALAPAAIFPAFSTTTGLRG
jgi:hypothetical protein